MEQNKQPCGNTFTVDSAATKTPAFRKLEDLNLIDNFLFQEMLTQQEDGEKFARILLKTILGKPIRNVKIVPQKNIPGIDVDKHGIRLDAYIEEVEDELNGEMADAEIISSIYDIEPNATYERKTLPKRMRYYHGLIDTKLLSAGAGYDKLPNVFIIFILPYDPFGKNRMVYTVQNCCIEDYSIPYDDGARKMFLYTRGCEGNPSQELKDMLKYIEKSTAENITNQDIASVSELVNKVKKRKEVGINYMKSWEMEQMARDAGRDEMQEKLNQLTLLLSNADRMDDIIKAANNKDYQNALLKEFGL
ncbi:MAG: Rpn family recombination-promoting nuclease/putative transposase [Lachnospiraceae bacterium]|nr:Rpn family recombination-promoting nuclease/putative transposase [Lachnospiraceae bacterium]